MSLEQRELFYYFNVGISIFNNEVKDDNLRKSFLKLAKKSLKFHMVNLSIIESYEETNYEPKKIRLEKIKLKSLYRVHKFINELIYNVIEPTINQLMPCSIYDDKVIAIAECFDGGLTKILRNNKLLKANEGIDIIINDVIDEFGDEVISLDWRPDKLW
jgi:uncharacterized protein YnzC (UPF0291/DUF896 family)